MRSLIAIVLALTACGCGTRVTHKSAAYSAAADVAILKRESTVFHLHDGTQIDLANPRDFGVGFCSWLNGCVARERIASISWTERKTSLGDDVGYRATLAASAPFILAFCASQSVYCPTGLNLPSPRSKGPPAERIWLQNGSNGCVGYSAAFREHPPFTTDREALDWVWENRLKLTGDCLSSASEAESVMQADGRERARRLYALGTVHSVWFSERCSKRGKWSFGVPVWLDLSPGRGDPAALAAIAEALADPASYPPRDDYRHECMTGEVFSEAELQALRERIAARSIFDFSRKPEDG
jgi:hypothetical protein